MRILVIEDEHKIANAIRKGLEQENYAVDVSYDADDGYAMALTVQYDAIVLDYMLPGERNGLELCQDLRKKNIHTPILFLTAKDQTRDKINGLNAGADDYLVKPFSFEELLARIRALFRRPNITSSPILVVGDLTLDPSELLVKRLGVEIQLSSKEFGLLEYLMRNTGQILSKDLIIDHVWDFDSDILPNTVEVFIGYLRSKIEKPFVAPKLIHTVRGFGYKILDPGS
ncbi:MAG: response regulator transcription factor [Acidimicrobiia bacterium]|nr:response regulator transcription factor [Acidimicrobiia bacterium]